MLGVFPDGTYGQDRVAIGSGDRLVLFTDGITEARDAADEEFGEDRLVALGDASIARAARRRSRPGSPTPSRRSPAGQFQDDATLIVHGGRIDLPRSRSDIGTNQRSIGD